MWLAQDDSAYDGGENNPNVLWFQVTATYTDDGKSTVTDANFVNLSWGWDPDGVNGEVQRGVTEVSDIHTPGVGGGTVTAIYKTEYNATDPNYTTDITGYFDIQLEVTDGTGTATGASGHHEIHATCGGAAYWDPDDTFDGTYDFNGDCIVNLADFADLQKHGFIKASNTSNHTCNGVIERRMINRAPCCLWAGRALLLGFKVKNALLERCEACVL